MISLQIRVSERVSHLFKDSISQQNGSVHYKTRRVQIKPKMGLGLCVYIMFKQVWRFGVTGQMSIWRVSQCDVVLWASEEEVGLLIAAWSRSRGVTALKENFLKLTSHTLASMFKEDVVTCGFFTTDSGQTVRVMVRLELVIVSSLNTGAQEEACH